MLRDLGPLFIPPTQPPNTGLRHTRSPRLRRVLHGLLASASPKRIAARHGLSLHTVYEYVKRLYRHHDTSGRGELLALFVQPPSWPPPVAASVLLDYACRPIGRVPEWPMAWTANPSYADSIPAPAFAAKDILRRGVYTSRPLGRMPEWTNGTDCKSVFRGFESHSGL